MCEMCVVHEMCAMREMCVVHEMCVQIKDRGLNFNYFLYEFSI